MDDDFDNAPPAAEPPGIGEQLRAAREGQGLSLEQVASETRIPQRHLVAIEAGDFGRLPGRTYAVGFSRTYAKMVGLDQDDVAALVRAEIDAQAGEGEYRAASFEPGDPARVPSRWLAWFAAFALLLLLAGVFFFFRTMFAPAGELPSLVQPETSAPATGGSPPRTATRNAPVPTGPVVFTALEQGIWVKFYDGAGRQLMQKQMDLGESYTVPADAQQPQLWTGRPDALAITIGGQRVPRLAQEERIMRDVPVTAEALLARGRGPAPAGENPAPAAT